MIMKKKKEVKFWNDTIQEIAKLRKPDVSQRSEQLPCGDCENYAEYDGGIKYCSVCGTKLS